MSPVGYLLVILAGAVVVFGLAFTATVLHDRREKADQARADERTRRIVREELDR